MDKIQIVMREYITEDLKVLSLLIDVIYVLKIKGASIKEVKAALPQSDNDIMNYGIDALLEACYTYQNPSVVKLMVFPVFSLGDISKLPRKAILEFCDASFSLIAQEASRSVENPYIGKDGKDYYNRATLERANEEYMMRMTSPKIKNHYSRV